MSKAIKFGVRLSRAVALPTPRKNVVNGYDMSGSRISLLGSKISQVREVYAFSLKK